MMLPPPITVQRFEEIIGIIKEGLGNRDLRDEIVEGHLRLAATIAAKMSSFVANFFEELRGEAFLELTEAAEKIWSRQYKVTNAEHGGRYISESVYRRCKDAVQARRTTTMPARTLRFRLKEGINPDGKLCDAVYREKLSSEYIQELRKLPIEYQEPLIAEAKTSSITVFAQRVRETIYDLVPMPKKITTVLEDYPISEDEDRKQLGKSYVVPIAKPVVSPEFVEALRKSVSSAIEQRIVELRSEGYTLQEVGPQVGLSHVAVHKKLAVIEQRFDEYYK